MSRRRSLYRRVYLHGVLLLVVLVVTLSAVFAFIGREARYHMNPGRLVEHVSHVLEAMPPDALPSVVTRVADELDVDLAVYAADGRQLAAAGVKPPPPLAPVDAARRAHDREAARGPPLRVGAPGRRPLPSPEVPLQRGTTWRCAA